MNKQNKKDCIIVVEDNPADVKLIQLAIGNTFPTIDFIYLKDGIELLEYLSGERSQQTIKLIIMDYNMPKLNGAETLIELDRMGLKSEALPVVIFSSSSNYPDILKCYELGANAYTVKPLDFGSYEKILQSVTTFWGKLKPVTLILA